MGLLKEAEYIYWFAKGLVKLNKRLKRLGRKAEKHKARHGKAPEHKKGKHRARHGSTVGEIREVMEKHNLVYKRLKRHHLRFAHYLRKEHKL